MLNLPVTIKVVSQNTVSELKMNKQTVPSFSLKKQAENLKTQLQVALQGVIDSQQFVGGAYVDGFEKALAKYLNVNHVISCNSGTDALWMALKVMGVKKDTIVLTTPFSFIASASEISAHGGHSVFIDIEDKTFNIDPVKLEEWLAANTFLRNGQLVEKKTGYHVAGIVVVDIFGQCADYKKLQQIAKKWNLWIIEDACQAIAAEVDGVKTGNFGDITAFSFYPTKNLGAFGDGGCCSTNDPILAENLLRQRNHGRKTGYEYVEHGINSRLDGMQAAILTAKLPFLNEWTERRRAIANIYKKELAGLKNIKLPDEIFGKHVYHQFSILVETKEGLSMRGDLEKFLADRGVGTRIFYPQTLSSIEFLNSCEELRNDCPISERVTRSVLALPMWPELEDSQVLYVCEQIRAWDKK